jgi:leucyl-tRNA synthetase
MDYGSGAVMAVPAHDERDWEFAKKYDLPLKVVICDAEGAPADIRASAYTERGVLTASDRFDGCSFDTAFEQIAKALTDIDMGRVTTQFRLRDWGVSRQRYWGTPIPMLNLADGQDIPIPMNRLPSLLPEDVVMDGVLSPIKADTAWRKFALEGQACERETDTFDTFVQSSWYYARFTCPDYAEGMLDSEQANYWLPVDQYVGGIEHAILHLLYARFFHKLMRDAGLVSSDEPFKRLLTQGMVLKDGAKMSKSRGNTVDPQPLIDTYGADTVRLFSMFAAPPDQSLEWSDSGVEGAHRFIKRLWRLAHDVGLPDTTVDLGALTSAQKNLRRKVHETIAKVTDDYGRRQTFNTAVAAIMELCNELGRHQRDAEQDRAVVGEGVHAVLRMLWPITPHLCEYLWRQLSGDAFEEGAWPSVDDSALDRDELEIVIQVNGKVRGKMSVPATADSAEIEALAKDQENVQRFLVDKTIKKVVVVPKKLVNIVAQ